MLTKEENELLTRVAPGTPLGELMRRYWMPALLSEELREADGPPVRVRLLGEQLVAFRDTDGRVGLLDEFCGHRGTSLWLGRNEECGIRCVFHGWKYDVTGQCVDQMNEPESFAHKIKLQAYPTVEMGGIVWAYMGPPEKQPPEPKFEWTQVPAASRFVTKTWEECNWLQALEGGIDTSHASILHRTLTEHTTHSGIKPSTPWLREGKARAPWLEIEVTNYGYRYFGVRPLSDEGHYVRGYHYVMPFTQIRPHRVGAPLSRGHFWVPMDDENCMVYNWGYNYGGQPLSDAEREDDSTGPENVSSDQGYRKKRNPDNQWLVDRMVQRSETFTGIEGINTQDHAVQESMGPIVDRTREHLGPADKAVITARQLLLKAVRTAQDGGDPPGVGTSYYTAHAFEQVLPVEVPPDQAVQAVRALLYREPATV